VGAVAIVVTLSADGTMRKMRAELATYSTHTLFSYRPWMSCTWKPV
jgi:hypothetical protein